MNLGAPVEDLVPAVRGALLQELARLERPVTRRQLAAAAGVAPGNASAVIEELVGTGLVLEAVAGRASMVRLNRDHLYAGPLLALAGARGELVGRLRERISQWKEIRGAWLFGSVARGDASSTSDIDVLIIADDLTADELHDRLSTLETDVRAWTGNDLQLVEHTPDSWNVLVEAANPLVQQVRQDGIALVGTTAPAPRRRAR